MTSGICRRRPMQTISLIAFDKRDALWLTQCRKCANNVGSFSITRSYHLLIRGFILHRNSIPTLTYDRLLYFRDIQVGSHPNSSPLIIRFIRRLVSGRAGWLPITIVQFWFAKRSDISVILPFFLLRPVTTFDLDIHSLNVSFLLCYTP